MESRVNAHRFFTAQDRPGQRLIAILREHYQLVHGVLGRVLGHGDFLKHHALFALDIGFVQARMQKDVRQNVHCQRQILIHRLGVKAGAFLAGEGVQRAADRVHFLGDVARAAPLGALEQHVLNEMAHAVFRRLFILRTARHPQAYGYRTKVRNALANDRNPIVQHKLIEHTTS